MLIKDKVLRIKELQANYALGPGIADTGARITGELIPGESLVSTADLFDLIQAEIFDATGQVYGALNVCYSSAMVSNSGIVHIFTSDSNSLSAELESRVKHGLFLRFLSREGSCLPPSQ